MKSKSTPVLKKPQTNQPDSRQQQKQQSEIKTFQHQQTSQANKPIKVIVPPTFKPTETSLIDSKNEFMLIDSVFKNIDDKIIRDQYTSFSNLSFEAWVNRGMEITSKQHELVKNIVVVRSKANMKFKFIFQLINNYGNSLESTDAELHLKISKLQKLGQEITAFIA